MSYLETIRKEYKLVQQNGIGSQATVKMALQYENWKNLPGEITRKIRDHKDYPDLDANSDKRPVPGTSQLSRDCQIDRKPERIALAYSLHRIRPSVSSPPLDKLNIGDLPKIWDLIAKDKSKSAKGQSRKWVTGSPLTLRSEQDLCDLVCRLGMHHWQETLPGTDVFCLKLTGIDCVKPNALDADLAFYFHQTVKTPGRTRNLKTGQPDMEEWLCLKVNHDSMQCVGGCTTRTGLKIDMATYFDNCARRIQDNTKQKAV